MSTIVATSQHIRVRIAQSDNYGDLTHAYAELHVLLDASDASAAEANAFLTALGKRFEQSREITKAKVVVWRSEDDFRIEVTEGALSEHGPWAIMCYPVLLDSGDSGLTVEAR